MTAPPSPNGHRFSIRMGIAGNVRELAERARDAEAAGFDQIWTGNDFLGESGLVALPAIALATRTIHLGAGVIDPVSIHPGQIAMFASALQELSGGRFLLGLGAGSDAFFRRAGIAAPAPVPRTRNAILAIRALTHGESPKGIKGVTAAWAENARLRFHHPVPIYVGAMGPRMLDLTGRLADGALPLCLPPRHVRRVREQIAAGAAAAGRSVEDLDIAACLWTSVDPDREIARRLLARQIARYAGSLSVDALAANGFDPDEFARTQHILDSEGEAAATASVSPRMLALGIAGSAADVIAGAAELLAMGVRHVSFGPPLGSDRAAAIRLIGNHVLPELRRMAA